MLPQSLRSCRIGINIASIHVNLLLIAFQHHGNHGTFTMNHVCVEFSRIINVNLDSRTQIVFSLYQLSNFAYLHCQSNLIHPQIIPLLLLHPTIVRLLRLRRKVGQQDLVDTTIQLPAARLSHIAGLGPSLGYQFTTHLAYSISKRRLFPIVSGTGAAVFATNSTKR